MLFVKIFFYIIVFNIEAQETRVSGLPKLSTKQDVNNLRFLSQDGKYTYYQRRSGALVLSTNFRSFKVIKSTAETQYSITSTPFRKYLTVSADENFFTFFGLNRSNKIYVVKYGTDKATFIGSGNNPQLHLNDTWISFYKGHENEIHFVNVETPVLKFKIQLSEKKNVYFSPSSLMKDIQHILYIDQNEKGIYGLIQFDRNTTKFKILYKLADPFQKIEICESNKYIFLGIFGLHSYKKGGKILFTHKEKINFSDLYSSKLSDIGNLLCDFNYDKIYFIQTQENNDSELVELNPSLPKDGRIKVLSDLKSVSQVIQMDGKLLIPFHGDFYVPTGEDNYRNKDNLVKIKDENK